MYALWKDGVLVNYVDDVIYRMDAATIAGIGGLFFSTFMGGGETDVTWAPPQDQSTEYEYARLYTVSMYLCQQDVRAFLGTNLGVQ